MLNVEWVAVRQFEGYLHGDGLDEKNVCVTQVYDLQPVMLHQQVA